MPLHSADALILRTYKLGEADRIVVFLTRDRGKRRGVARGARRTRSRFLGTLEPMTCVRMGYFEREHRELVSLDYAEIVVSPLSTEVPEALAYVGYFAELLDEWAPEGDPNERLYRLGVSVVHALTTGVPPERLARYFEFWLLKLQGVYPSVARCASCRRALVPHARLAPHSRVYQCAECASGRDALVLSADALAFLRVAARVRADALREAPTGADALRELEAAHRWLMVAHLEREPRSIRVLRDLGQRGVPA